MNNPKPGEWWYLRGIIPVLVTRVRDDGLDVVAPHGQVLTDLSWDAMTEPVHDEDKAKAKASAKWLRPYLERIKELEAAIGDLVSLAEAAMLEANRDGGEYDVEAELREYVELCKENQA